jgi:hypothetical protein
MCKYIYKQTNLKIIFITSKTLLQISPEKITAFTSTYIMQPKSGSSTECQFCNLSSPLYEEIDYWLQVSYTVCLKKDSNFSLERTH